MGTRSLVAWAVPLVVALGFTRSVAADPKGDIAAKSKEAMESYDLMDYEAAKKSLNVALATARKAKLDKDPVTARIYLFLGIAAFANNDLDGAKAAFVSAVQIDGKIQIDAAYKSPELTKLLETARTEAGGGGKIAPQPPITPGVDCSAVKGLQHTILDTAKTNVNEPIEALVGSDITPVKVAVMYRTEGSQDFVEGKLVKQGDCKYTGAIPAAAKKGSIIHYYVAAYDANNKVIAGKGSSGSPNIMELVAGPPGLTKKDDEDPINGRKGGGKKTVVNGSNGGKVSGGVVVGGKPPKVYVGVVGGTGISYVSGKTEGDGDPSGGNDVKNPGIANSLVVITPELGYHVSPQMSIGVAVRLGIPVGANIEGHSTMAPGGLLRVRYALASNGEGVRVMGQAGAGILRNTIKLDDAMAGMGDTDIVAQGPLLVGAGVGYTKRLGGIVAFVADVSALGAIAVTKKLGSAPRLNTGFAADFSLGFSFGF